MTSCLLRCRSRAGLLRLLLTVGRRLIAGQVSLAVEFDLRQVFYEHLQKLELAFFDSQQTGQLMSRATVDLQSIRFFLGYGLIWVSQSALTIFFAAVAMFLLDPLLAVLALAPVPFLVATATRYSRRNRPAEQEVQQRIGEATASAEESVSGIRIVKAFARERHMLDRFRHSVNRVFEQSMVSARLQSFYTPLMGFLPNLGLAAVLLVGGNQVISGSIRAGELAAFVSYIAMLSGPVRWLGMSLSMAQRATASGNRMFEILDREPTMQSPPGAPPLPGGRAGSLQRVTLRYDGSEPALRGSTSRWRRGARLPWSGPPPPARPAWWACSRACTTPARTRGDRRRRYQGGRSGVVAIGDRVRRRRQLPVLRHRGRQYRLREARRHARAGRVGGPPRAGP